MLGLNLRKEFQGQRLRSPALELTYENNTSAPQIPVPEFLEMTYLWCGLFKAEEHLAKEVRYVLAESNAPVLDLRAIVSPRSWGTSRCR